MTEPDLETRLRAAQQAEADEADPGALAELVHSIPERVEPQRRHWWSGLRNGAERSTDDGGNSSKGRRNHMILATSIAGVAVIALGGVFAAGQLGDGSATTAPGAQLSDVEPREWLGNLQKGPCPGEATETVIGAAVQDRGKLCHPTTANMSDARMSGVVTLMSNDDDYLGGIGGVDGGGFSIGLTRMTIQNDEGLWRLVPGPEVSLDGVSGTLDSYVFVGEGGYDGLLSVAVGRPDRFGQELRGYIVRAELPPEPRISASE
jgi:hypothetical protein